LLAIAGISAGATAVAVVPAPALATPAAPAAPARTAASAGTARTGQPVGSARAHLTPSGRGATMPAPRTAAADPECNGSIRVHSPDGGDELWPAFNGSPLCTLRQGDTGVPVTKIQDALVKCYGQDLGPTGVDGNFGPLTDRSIRNVQNFKGLPATGVYDHI